MGFAGSGAHNERLTIRPLIDQIIRQHTTLTLVQRGSNTDLQEGRQLGQYSAGYAANHWCKKGHILLCLSGELQTELADGRVVVLKAGMSYQVADDAEAHRSRTQTGATLFIVD